MENLRNENQKLTIRCQNKVTMKFCWEHNVVAFETDAGKKRIRVIVETEK